jgi:hypothetical protein
LGRRRTATKPKCTTNKFRNLICATDAQSNVENTKGNFLRSKNNFNVCVYAAEWGEEEDSGEKLQHMSRGRERGFFGKPAKKNSWMQIGVVLLLVVACDVQMFCGRGSVGCQEEDAALPEI